MKIPGFTAEESLSKGAAFYCSPAEAVQDNAAVRLAQSDVLDPGPPPSLVNPGSVFQPGHPVYCLKFRCFPDPLTLECHWIRTVGIVDPMTGRCQ